MYGVCNYKTDLIQNIYKLNFNFNMRFDKEITGICVFAKNLHSALKHNWNSNKTPPARGTATLIVSIKSNQLQISWTF